tara:strand:- start:117 stop:326 length:210 start_codon:yes stop_codon:yes gene_type:complete
MTKRNTHTVWDHILKEMQQKLKIKNTDPPKFDDDKGWDSVLKKLPPIPHDHPDKNKSLEEIMDDYIYSR